MQLGVKWKFKFWPCQANEMEDFMAKYCSKKIKNIKLTKPN